MGSFSGGSDESGSVAELFPAVINLNVGGRKFTTHLSTLTKDPNSMLAAMFSGRHPVSKDQDGCYFIDVDGDIFAHVLNYLRFEKLPPVNAAFEVYEYAVYFGIQSLEKEMKLFESVMQHTFIEKAKSYYPDYKELLSNIAVKLEEQMVKLKAHGGTCNVNIVNVGVNALAHCVCYRCHGEDEDGKMFRSLIITEFLKRGIVVSIQDDSYRGKGSFRLSYQYNLYIYDNTLKALNTISLNTNRIH